LFLADAYDDVIVRQLVLKKINGGRRKRDGGNEIAIAQNVVDFFDNIWPGNRDLNKKKVHSHQFESRSLSASL